MSKDSQAAEDKPTIKEETLASKADPKPAATEPTTAKPVAKPAATKPTAKPVAKPAATKPTTAKPAAKKPVAKEPPPPPEFEKGISDKIIEKFGDKVESTFIKPDRVGIKAGREDVHTVAEFIRDEMKYDHVESVSGVDYADQGEIEVVYHIASYSDDSLSRQIIALSTRAQREDDPIPGGDATRLPSLRDVFYSVEFHEREIFEMFGVYFEGHPDNRRLLLPEDWADLPPLRKDFAIKGR